MILACQQSKQDVVDTENEREVTTEFKNSTNSSLDSPNSSSEISTALSTGTKISAEHRYTKSSFFLWKLDELICYLTLQFPLEFIKAFMSNAT